MTETLNNSFNLIRASLESFIASLPALIIALLAFVIIYRISAPIAGVVREPLRRTKRSLSLQIIIVRLGRVVCPSLPPSLDYLSHSGETGQPDDSAGLRALERCSYGSSLCSTA